jgi:hypothetical protein
VNNQPSRPTLLGAFSTVPLVLVAALALGGCASSPGAANHTDFSAAIQKGDTLIIPGERVGPIRLGMSRDEVVRLLGKPGKVVNFLRGANGEDNGYQYIYNHKIFIGFPPGRSPTVTEIVTQDPRFVTEQGARLGDSLSDLVRKQGLPEDPGFIGTSGGRRVTYGQGYKHLRVHISPAQQVDEMSISLVSWGAYNPPITRWNGGNELVKGEVGYRLEVDGPRLNLDTRWSANHMIVSGSFPPGVEWGPGGQITGIPKRRGHFWVTVKLYNITCNGHNDDQHLSFEQQLHFHITGSGTVEE